MKVLIHDGLDAETHTVMVHDRFIERDRLDCGGVLDQLFIDQTHEFLWVKTTMVLDEAVHIGSSLYYSSGLA